VGGRPDKGKKKKKGAPLDLEYEKKKEGIPRVLKGPRGNGRKETMDSEIKRFVKKEEKGHKKSLISRGSPKD